jgi:hypothetical protein
MSAIFRLSNEKKKKMITEDNLPLTQDEAKALKHFLHNCGPISYEFHAPIHELYKKLTEFLGEESKIRPITKKNETD